jgi:chromosome partitioning protein
LKDALTEYPLPHDLMILTVQLPWNTSLNLPLVAATHLLIPLMPDAKAVDGTRVLLDWYAASIQELQLNNPPPFLGFVINNVEDGAEHQRLSHQIPAGYQARGYHVFPLIRHYTAFINAWSEGVPLRINRKTHLALKPIGAIVDAIVKELGGKERGKARSDGR